MNMHWTMEYPVQAGNAIEVLFHRKPWWKWPWFRKSPEPLFQGLKAGKDADKNADAWLAKYVPSRLVSGPTKKENGMSAIHVKVWVDDNSFQAELSCPITATKEQFEQMAANWIGLLKQAVDSIWRDEPVTGPSSTGG